VARRTAFAASDPSLIAVPLVGGTLFMGGASASTGYLPLFLAIHRSESATAALASFHRSVFCHIEYPPVLRFRVRLYAPQNHLAGRGGDHAHLHHCMPVTLYED
jgi:hypothetical protein